jgi:hypothetical protein
MRDFNLLKEKRDCMLSASLALIYAHKRCKFVG